MERNRLFACLFLTLAQVSVAINVILAKLILPVLPTFLFLTLRFALSSLYLLLCMVLLKQQVAAPAHPIGVLQRRDWGFLVGQAFTGGFLFNFLFYQGIVHTTATSAGIISSVLPVMIALCAYSCLGERLTSGKLLSIGLAAVGIVVISLDNNAGGDEITGSFFGDFLILLAMLPEALYSIFNKFMSARITPLGGATIINGLIFLMMLPLCVVACAETPIDIFAFSPFIWLWVALSGFCNVLFFWLWAKGLSVIAASTAAVFGGVLPVVTALLAYLFLGEQLSLYNFLGMILVLVSLAVMAK